MVVTYTPKYHAEIAGVSIEYSWGATKSRFRRIPYEQKKTREKFFEAVRTSLKVLTKETVRKCARRARHYIQAYYVVEVLRLFEGVEEAAGENGALNQQITLPMIEKLQKAFKTHRSAISFDGKFIENLLDD
jgi:hypothetical protein